MKNQILWKKIKNFKLDQEDVIFCFSQRLARDNNWSLDYSLEVIKEYKKFIYLCCISNHQITPSDSVDQAWHLHLTYTKSYWVEFCNETLGKEIHHNPTKGGGKEKAKFSDCYNSTFEIYKSEFGHEPNSAIWRDNKSRFSEINFRRINIDQFWLIPKPSNILSLSIKLLIIAIAIPFLFIGASYNSAFSFVVIAIAILIFIYNWKGKKNNRDDSGCGDCSSDIDDSGCSSGCSGCGGCGD